MKYLFLFFLLISGNVWANTCSTPSSSYTYVSGNTILPNQVQTNENNIYTYLQSGVCGYQAGSITQAAVSSTAGILYSQLNLSGGILPTDFNTSTTTSIYQLENVLVPSTGNITDNGTFNFGVSHQGDILSDNGISIVRIPSSNSTIGEVLQSQGVSSNAQWATPSLYTFNSSTPSAISSFTINGLSSGVRYKLILDLTQNTSNGAITMNFNGDSGGSDYQWVNGYAGSGGTTSSANGQNAGQIDLSIGGSSLDSGSLMHYELSFTATGHNTIVSGIGTVTHSSTEYALLISGLYSGSSNLSSITITTSAGTLSGNATIYEMN